jgi:hypothetical protein
MAASGFSRVFRDAKRKRIHAARPFTSPAGFAVSNVRSVEPQPSGRVPAGPLFTPFFKEWTMKSLYKSLFFGIVAAGMASFASAQVDVTVSGPTTVSNGNSGTLHSFVVNLDAAGALRITAFDLQLNAASNVVHQVQLHDADTQMGVPSPFENNQNTPSRIAADTHLLFRPEELNGLQTDANEPPLAGPPNDGSRIQGFVGGLAFDTNAQGIVGGAPQPNGVDVFQVVLAPNTTATLSGLVAVQNEASTRMLGPVIVPEPTFLGMLAIAGLAAVRRRRGTA